ncbi:MAG: GNAT family N-acetyltransferase [Candidatus Hodarchaeales archaeon]|jgi:predicted acetyltransferase
MEFRILNEDDMIQQQELMRYSFEPKKGNYEEIDLEILKKYVSPLTYFGMFDGDVLASSLIIIHFFQKIRGYTFSMAGVAGVATKPEYRRKGLVRKLFDEAFSFCLKEKMPISTLYPFKYSYYEQFDYVWVDDLIILTGNVSDIKKIETKDYTVEEEKSYEKAIARVKPLYKQFYDNVNGLIERSKSNNVFERRLDKGYFFFSKNNTGKDTGYIVLRFNDEETISVREVIALDKQTRQNLWNFISLHKDQRKYYKISDYYPHSIQSYPYIKEPREISHKVIANSMLRIVNVQDVLENIAYPNNTESIDFELNDEICKWNNGCWNLTVEKGIGKIKKIDKTGLNTKIDNKGLALLLAGFRNTTELLEQNYISGYIEDLKKIDRIFPKEWFIVRDWF